jgi:tryptophan synthase beta chain
LGSVLNHVMLHQTIIGQEAMKQMEKVDEYPDIIIGCCGGGSNFAGISFPYVREKIVNGKQIDIIAVEPAACPTLTKGAYAYDFGDTAKLAPVAMMYTLGHDFVPPGIHAGGLRYHGESPLVSRLYKDGLIDAVSVRQTAVFEAAVTFARSEGILPAPESAHAIRAVIDKALACKESGEEKVILFNLSGHGHFDLSAYDAYNANQLVDVEYTDEMLEEGLKSLPKF